LKICCCYFYIVVAVAVTVSKDRTLQPIDKFYRFFVVAVIVVVDAVSIDET